MVSGSITWQYFGKVDPNDVDMAAMSFDDVGGGIIIPNPTSPSKQSQQKQNGERESKVVELTERRAPQARGMRLKGAF